VIETTLLRWVTAGVCSAVLVTGLMGFLSWRTGKEAVEDADWVAHTYAVKAALEDTLQHVVEVESGARTFNTTGKEVFLDPYLRSEQAIVRRSWYRKGHARTQTAPTSFPRHTICIQPSVLRRNWSFFRRLCLDLKGSLCKYPNGRATATLQKVLAQPLRTHTIRHAACVPKIAP
jgi:hypothetical protein